MEPPDRYRESGGELAPYVFQNVDRSSPLSRGQGALTVVASALGRWPGGERPPFRHSVWLPEAGRPRARAARFSPPPAPEVKKGGLKS